MSLAAVAPAPPVIDAAIVERVLLHGDLRQLTAAQKISYYKSVCDSVGLNPLTQPFAYLVLNGKEILYAKREATEQLRKIHDVSIQITAREVMGDCYVVAARATLPGGRQDENIGAVPIANVSGDARANAMMKAETKAKRRVTLSICGLGMLDETEVDAIPADAPEPVIQIEHPPGRDTQPAPPPVPRAPLSPAAATGETRGTPVQAPRAASLPRDADSAARVAPNAREDSGRSIPAGFARIDAFKPDPPFWHVTWGRDAQGGSVVYKTKIQKIADAARDAFDARVPVRLHCKKAPWLDKVEVAADDTVPF